MKIPSSELLIRAILILALIPVSITVISILGKLLTLGLLLGFVYYLYKRSGWNIHYFYGFGIGKAMLYLETAKNLITEVLKTILHLKLN